MIATTNDQWEIKKLTDLAELIMGQAPSGETYNERGEGLPLIAGAADLGETFPSPKKFTTSPVKRSALGDIILCVRATIGNLNWADKEYCYGRGVAGIRVKPIIDSEFLFYWLDVNKNYLQSLGRGATFKQISKQDIATLSVPVPHPDEQRRIVNRIKECLSRVDEIKRLRQGARREAQALENALLNEIEADLSVMQEPLEHVVLSTRNGFSLHAAEQDYNGSVLTLTAVRTFNLDLNQCKPAQLNKERVAKYGVRLGDVFISRSNTPALVGLSAIVIEQPPERIIYSDLLIRITPHPEKVLPQYLTIALRFPSVRKQIQSYARGTSQSMVKISGESLRKVQIPLPTLDEQNQVIHKVNTLQKSAVALINSLETGFINYLPQAVLRKAFAGEL